MTPDKFSSMKIFFVCVFLSLQCYFISLSELAVGRCPKASYGDLIWGLSGQSTFDMIFFFFLKIWDQAKK